MLPWQSLPYPSSEITGKIKMEATSSDYVCIDPENPETIVHHHPSISDRNVPSISQIDISHRDFDYPEDLNCRLCIMDIRVTSRSVVNKQGQRIMKTTIKIFPVTNVKICKN